MTTPRRLCSFCLSVVLGTLLSLTPRLHAADTASPVPDVRFKAERAKPRAVETLTSQRVVHDYGEAWKDLADAFNDSAPERLGTYFVGPANDALAIAIGDQKKTGVHSRYLGQSHQVEAVFYAPEGDVMELHDTMVCDFQLLDGGNVIHDEHVTLNYVVLMTPAADRWVVRQLQAVPKF